MVTFSSRPDGRVGNGCCGRRAFSLQVDARAATHGFTTAGNRPIGRDGSPSGSFALLDSVCASPTVNRVGAPPGPEDHPTGYLTRVPPGV